MWTEGERGRGRGRGSERAADVGWKEGSQSGPGHKPFIYMFYLMFVCRPVGFIYYVAPRTAEDGWCIGRAFVRFDEPKLSFLANYIVLYNRALVKH